MPDDTFITQKKYEITGIAHPTYPWLHRIRALKAVNEQVEAGDLGGFVQSEGNLSQEGRCWIHNNAICCEDAVVEKDAQLFHGAMASGCSLVTGDACLSARARAKGNCCIRSGKVTDDAVVDGDAVIKEDAKGFSPLIAGNSWIYGMVSGRYVIRDTVFPGETYKNPTENVLFLENGKRRVQEMELRLCQPKAYQKAEKKRGGPER